MRNSFSSRGNKYLSDISPAMLLDEALHWRVAPSPFGTLQHCIPVVKSTMNGKDLGIHYQESRHSVERADDYTALINDLFRTRNNVHESKPSMLYRVWKNADQFLGKTELAKINIFSVVRNVAVLDKYPDFWTKWLYVAFSWQHWRLFPEL